MSAPVPGCELCAGDGGQVVWREGAWRVVRVADRDFPAFYRVIHADHVREFSDLDLAGRQRCMALVAAVERVLRERLAPTKINLASLGNLTPHLHWHVIARFDWDSRFPQPVWAPAVRDCPDAASRLAVPLHALDAAVSSALG